MTAIGKGAILGAIAMAATTLIWLAAGDGGPPAATAGFGLVVGVPWGIAFGCALGALTTQLTAYRKAALAIAAPVLALAVAALTTPFLRCSFGPHAVTLFARAFVPLALASLALERWTREPERLPVAQLR
jgi:hypothetical protein